MKKKQAGVLSLKIEFLPELDALLMKEKDFLEQVPETVLNAET